MREEGGGGSNVPCVVQQTRRDAEAGARLQVLLLLNTNTGSICENARFDCRGFLTAGRAFVMQYRKTMMLIGGGMVLVS
jgi:hypothetical protein